VPAPTPRCSSAELELLFDSGLTPCKPSWPAPRGRPNCSADRIGAVKPGYFAGLLVVRGDPVSSITATRSVALVIKSGRIVWHDAAREL
jgi:hypothetical protein